MNEEDSKRLIEVLNGALDIYGKVRSDVAIALWCKLLAPFRLEHVEAALATHLRTSKFAPTPADITQLIVEQDGRPGPDEAWSMIPRDERSSVFWTEEMAKAYGVAAPLLAEGDQVAARKAFIEVYGSEVRAARLAGIPIKVTPSWGFDPDGRDAAILAAFHRGLLSDATATKFLAMRPREYAPGVPALLKGIVKPMVTA
jgi:hypothetical protein